MSNEFKVHMPNAAGRAARPSSGAVKPAAKPAADPKAEILKAAAERAKAEAEARRKQGDEAGAYERELQGANKQAEEEARRARELGGPEGPEPTRYGDWEKKGICYDF